ncbi:MAG: bifunctional glutamate N-acetyltransferase/amino-acid acetyltransferase ArgJ [Planctomycetota bacterium]
MASTLAKGYRFAGVSAGIKKSAKRDVAVLVSDSPATAVGMFTTNRVCAAPVQCCRRRLPSTKIRGIVINSGNANACTGEQGLANAERMTELLAKQVGCSKDDILVCSTGIIGRPLPMEKVESGISDAFTALSASEEGFESAANGILTTDTGPKTSCREVKLSGGKVVVQGMAKGAAMIGPNMATMLAFVCTDAKVETPILQTVLKEAVDQSFHCISVEGHTSTNDSVLLLANGASGVEVTSNDRQAFAEAVAEVCMDLAKEIARDAEEASHLIVIDVTGTRTNAEARLVAKTVADSALVKTAIYGNDPNWGRICSAAGYAGIEFAEKDLSLRVNGTLLYDQGTPTDFDAPTESAKMKASRDTHVELTFGLGQGRCRFWTCDLTVGYVRFNADYTT